MRTTEYILKSNHNTNALVSKARSVGTGVWEEVCGEVCCFCRVRPVSLIKPKGVTKQVFVDAEFYFCFYWTHWASSVNLYHTVYFGNKPKACKEANSSCKKKEDQNHYHGIAEVQNCTCCSCDLQLRKEVMYRIY